MHLVYVDESGDPGSLRSPTDHYVLAGLCLAASDWHSCHQGLHRLRERMHASMGLSLEAEIHAAEFLGGARRHQGLEAWQRVRAAHWVVQDLARLPAAKLLLAQRCKAGCVDVLGECWRELCVQALASAGGDTLLIVTDTTDGPRVIEALAGLETAARERIIDDPFHRDSRKSLLLQTVDLVAYLHRQAFRPNGLFRSGSADQLQRDFARLLGDRSKGRGRV